MQIFLPASLPLSLPLFSGKCSIWAPHLFFFPSFWTVSSQANLLYLGVLLLPYCFHLVRLHCWLPSYFLAPHSQPLKSQQSHLHHYLLCLDLLFLLPSIF